MREAVTCADCMTGKVPTKFLCHTEEARAPQAGFDDTSDGHLIV